MITEKELLEKGFIKENDNGIINFELRLAQDRVLVITPQLKEIFVWFEEEEMKVFINTDTLDNLLLIAKSLIGIE